MNEHPSTGPGLRADGGETNPAKRSRNESAAAASPDDAAQRDEVRRFLNLLIATALITMLIDVVASIASSSPRWFGPVIVGGLFGAWVAARPRRAIDHEDLETIVNRVAIVLIAWIFTVVLFQPFLALALVPAYLVPIAAALPYLEGRRLRLVMGLAWAAALGSMLVYLLPDDSSAPTAVTTLVELVALSVVIGVVFVVLYRSSGSLKASGREFRRLFQLSSDLAETTDPGVLGGHVVAEPFDLADQPTRTSVSIGVACRSAQDATINDLLRDADAAMYEAKAAGKGRAVLSVSS